MKLKRESYKDVGAEILGVPKSDELGKQISRIYLEYYDEGGLHGYLMDLLRYVCGYVFCVEDD